MLARRAGTTSRSAAGSATEMTAAVTALQILRIFVRGNLQHCRGVYISDSILVDLGRCLVANFFSPMGDKANFNLSTFLEIVNCNFAQTFSIDSKHWHGDRAKISRARNSCNSKKLGRKISIFFFKFSQKQCGILAFRLQCTS